MGHLISEYDETEYIRLLIKQFLKDSGISLNKAVETINTLHPTAHMTAQNISNKLARGTIRFNEMVNIAKACGYTVEFKPIKPKTIRESKPKEYSFKPDFTTLAALGYARVDSPNFGHIVIAGEQADNAAGWLEDNIDSEISDAQELMLLIDCNRAFNVIAKPTAEKRNIDII